MLDIIRRIFRILLDPLLSSPSLSSRERSNEHRQQWLSDSLPSAALFYTQLYKFFFVYSISAMHVCMICSHSKHFVVRVVVFDVMLWWGTSDAGCWPLFTVWWLCVWWGCFWPPAYTNCCSRCDTLIYGWLVRRCLPAEKSGSGPGHWSAFGGGAGDGGVVHTLCTHCIRFETSAWTRSVVDQTLRRGQ